MTYLVTERNGKTFTVNDVGSPIEALEKLYKTEDLEIYVQKTEAFKADYCVSLVGGKQRRTNYYKITMRYIEKDDATICADLEKDLRKYPSLIKRIDEIIDYMDNTQKALLSNEVFSFKYYNDNSEFYNEKYSSLIYAHCHFEDCVSTFYIPMIGVYAGDVLAETVEGINILKGGKINKRLKGNELNEEKGISVNSFYSPIYSKLKEGKSLTFEQKMHVYALHTFVKNFNAFYKRFKAIYLRGRIFPLGKSSLLEV